jgi:hypothetical protein
MQATSQKEKNTMSRLSNVTTSLAALLLAAPCVMAADAPGFFKLPGTETSMQIYGYVALDATYDAKGDTGPLAGLSNADGTVSDDATAKNQWDMTAATSRLGVKTSTPSEFGDINLKLEGDFAKANGSAATFRLRHAYGEVGGFLFGQATSNFVDPDGSPDYMDWDGLLGDYYGTSRTPQARYTMNINKQSAVSVSIEKDYTGSFFTTTDEANTNTANKRNFPGAFVAAFNYGDSWGHVRAAGAYQKYSAWTAATDSTKSKTSFSWTLSGNVNLGEDSLVAHVGVGDGQYGAGLQDKAYQDTATSDIYLVQATQWDLGYTHVWTKASRSNLFVSQVSYSEDADKGMTGAAFKTYNQIGVNHIVKIGKNAQFGAEYIWGEAKTFDSGAITNPDGSTTDKISESKLRLQFKVNFF